MPDKDKRKKERVKSESEEQQERMLGGYNQETIDFIKGIKPEKGKPIPFKYDGEENVDWATVLIDKDPAEKYSHPDLAAANQIEVPVSLHSSDHPVTAMTDTKLSREVAKRLAQMEWESRMGNNHMLGRYEDDLMAAFAKIEDEYPDAEQTRENAERVFWGMLPLEYIETGELKLRPSSRDKGRPR